MKDLDFLFFLWHYHFRHLSKLDLNEQIAFYVVCYLYCKGLHTVLPHVHVYDCMVKL